MQHILIFITILSIHTCLFGQTLLQQGNETAEAFIDRHQPGNSLRVSTIIETEALDSSKKILTAFFMLPHYPLYETSTATYTDYSDNSFIVGYLYIPVAPGSYKQVILDTIPPDGGNPEIIAVFFANADVDKNNELVVLCKFDQFHWNPSGELYHTYIFDYSNSNTKYLKKLSERFYGCECQWENGKRSKARFKSETDIKTGLKKLGYKQ